MTDHESDLYYAQAERDELVRDAMPAKRGTCLTCHHGHGYHAPGCPAGDEVETNWDDRDGSA